MSTDLQNITILLWLCWSSEMRERRDISLHFIVSIEHFTLAYLNRFAARSLNRAAPFSHFKRYLLGERNFPFIWEFFFGCVGSVICSSHNFSRILHKSHVDYDVVVVVAFCWLVLMILFCFLFSPILRLRNVFASANNSSTSSWIVKPHNQTTK